MMARMPIFFFKSTKLKHFLISYGFIQPGFYSLGTPFKDQYQLMFVDSEGYEGQGEETPCLRVIQLNKTRGPP